MQSDFIFHDGFLVNVLRALQLGASRSSVAACLHEASMGEYSSKKSL